MPDLSALAAPYSSLAEQALVLYRTDITYAVSIAQDAARILEARSSGMLKALRTEAKLTSFNGGGAIEDLAFLDVSPSSSVEQTARALRVYRRSVQNFELTDEGWHRVQRALPVRAPGRGRPQKDNRSAVNGILHKVCVGLPWRSVPSRFGCWETIYYKYRKWYDYGVWHGIAGELRIRPDLGT